MILKNKVVLVTGGSSGMGEAMVLAFAREGCRVVFTYNSHKKNAEDVVKKVGEMGSKAFAVKVDLHSETEIEHLFKFVTKQFRTLDILVNSAGINTPTDLFDTKVWKEIFQVNLFSVVYCVDKAIKLMENGGKIINISSVYEDGKVCYKEIPVYGASKAALSHLTQMLARHLAPKILVNAIAPGYVRTPMWRNRTEEDFEQNGKEQLIGRMIMPEEIAEMAIAIAKNDAVTGEIIIVDGGLSLKSN
ncbi:MAG: hypothetical protein COY80_01700 [Candidatus Pacebacteria bacterium CG_4_10_14_0_8_um_filter_42_14]|nr:MAG: hypothetical protein COY80_01700 [Candidatus Pacebacteria bacterium CG_4_10_14_0_8_um_filter_42_14]